MARSEARRKLTASNSLSSVSLIMYVIFFLSRCFYFLLQAAFAICIIKLNVIMISQHSAIPEADLQEGGKGEMSKMGEVFRWLCFRDV